MECTKIFHVAHFCFSGKQYKNFYFHSIVWQTRLQQFSRSETISLVYVELMFTKFDMSTFASYERIIMQTDLIFTLPSDLISSLPVVRNKLAHKFISVDILPDPYLY